VPGDSGRRAARVRQGRRINFLGLAVPQLHKGGIEPDPADLDAWLAGAWTLVVDDMNPNAWAWRYRRELTGKP
jgi:hypothetical protein